MNKYHDYDSEDFKNMVTSDVVLLRAVRAVLAAKINDTAGQLEILNKERYEYQQYCLMQGNAGKKCWFDSMPDFVAKTSKLKAFKKHLEKRMPFLKRHLQIKSDEVHAERTEIRKSLVEIGKPMEATRLYSG